MSSRSICIKIRQKNEILQNEFDSDTPNSYRASIIETVILFVEQFAALIFDVFVSIIFRPVVKAGCLGVSRGTCSLLSHETTLDMVDRSLRLSWT